MFRKGRQKGLNPIKIDNYINNGGGFYVDVYDSRLKKKWHKQVNEVNVLYSLDVLTMFK